MQWLATRYIICRCHINLSAILLRYTVIPSTPSKIAHNSCSAQPTVFLDGNMQLRPETLPDKFTLATDPPPGISHYLSCFLSFHSTIIVNMDEEIIPIIYLTVSVTVVNLHAKRIRWPITLECLQLLFAISKCYTYLYSRRQS